MKGRVRKFYAAGLRECISRNACDLFGKPQSAKSRYLVTEPGVPAAPGRVVSASSPWM